VIDGFSNGAYATESLLGRSSSRRHDRANDLASILAIKPKISVKRKNGGAFHLFGHSYQTGVGQGHWPGTILLH
jgi:hypothetical protein